MGLPRENIEPMKGETPREEGSNKLLDEIHLGHAELKAQEGGILSSIKRLFGGK